VLVLNSLLCGKNSGTTGYQVSTIVWARATEWVVYTGGSAYSCGEDSGLGEGKEGSKRKEGEHLFRIEELVLSMCVKPHQDWKKTDV
jgi:hypothetical protein